MVSAKLLNFEHVCPVLGTVLTLCYAISDPPYKGDRHVMIAPFL